MPRRRPGHKRRPASWGALALAAALVAYNNLLGRWPLFDGALYVPVNLAATGIVAWVGKALLRLSSEDAGLGDRRLVSAATGAAWAATLTLPAWPVLLTGKAPLLADRRVAGIGPAALLYRLTIRIPLGTALFEEMAFRGVLHGAARRESACGLRWVPAAAFGLWHLRPALRLMEINRPGAARKERAAAAALAVCVTAAGGRFLEHLRDRSRGILMPAAFHACLNDLGALIGFVAARRTPR